MTSMLLKKYLRISKYTLHFSSNISIQQCRSISTTSTLYGKRNFRKFLCHDRGNPTDKKFYEENPQLVDRRGERLAGYYEGNKFVKIEEMVPEIIVPDLTGFTLKPYVSYRSMDVVQEKFTPKDLFDAIYAQKIQKDFNEGKLDDDGNSLEPSEEEKLTAEEAWIKAKKSGSDLFG